MKIKLILFLCIVCTLNSCDGQTKSTRKETQPHKIQTMAGNPKYQRQINELRSSMIDFMEMASPAYSQQDIDECVKILNEYLATINSSSDKKDGVEIVKNTVEKLNDLNQKCSSQLIETSERDQITEIIILASSDKGYNKPEEDITEEWREW